MNCSQRTALSALLFTAACAKVPQRPNVLLITIDTLRADRISALGGERKTTPNLDALAAEGLLFTHAETPRAKTTPAIASLMTGLYPHDHGVRDLVMPIELRFPLLAEKFQGGGYATGAIIGNFVLKNDFSGLARGFDSWVEDLPQTQGVPPDDVPQRTARSLTDGALVALGFSDAASADGGGPTHPLVQGEKPWFLWLHYMDPHGLYDPPAEHRVFERTTPDWIATGSERSLVAEYNVPPHARATDGKIDAALVRDLYDGEVHYVDDEIGRLIRQLRESGALDNTIVVVTADHGESLGEHDYWFEHGRDAYEASCRVPLIVRLPGPPAQVGRRSGDVSLADVAPTLLELAGLPPLDLSMARGPRGTSRASLVRADDSTPHAVFVEKVDRTEQDRAIQAKGVRIGDLKLLQRSTHLAGRSILLSEELYDLAVDPHETRNLIHSAPDAAVLATLRSELARFTAADLSFATLAESLEDQRKKLDPETLRIIESLGY